MKYASKVGVSLLLAMGILQFLTLPALAVQTAKATETQARQAAIFHLISDVKVDPESPWNTKKIKVDKGMELSAEKGEVSGYLFSIWAEGKPQGYITIGNDLDEYPVLEWAYQRHPVTDETLKQAKSKTKLGKSIRETRLTSLAAGDYAYRFTYEDGTSDAVTTSGKLLKQKQLVKAKSHEVNEKARAFWDQVNQAHLSTQTSGEIGTESDGVTDVNPNEWESGYSSISRNYIAQVPDYYQYIYDSANVNFTGCTPTASANMVQYLGFGLSDIDKTMWSLRSYLHTTQGETGDGWTLWDDETPGLLAYAKSVRPSANPTVTL